VLRTSLWAELTSLAKLMEDEIEYLEDNNFTWVPLFETFKIYVANIQNLGLLTPTEVQKVTVAYYRYQESSGYIAQTASRQANKHPIAKQHIEFDFSKKGEAWKKEVVVNELGEIASAARDAAKEIEDQLRATTDWFKPDLTNRAS